MTPRRGGSSDPPGCSRWSEHMTGRIFGRCFVAFTLAVLLGGNGTRAQLPAGFELALVDVDGTKKVLGQLPPTVYAPRISPDGKRVAFETRDPSGPDGPRLWTADLSDISGRRPLSLVAGAINWAPMWTPDGERLVFIVSGDRRDAVYWRRADGTGDAEHLIDTRAAEGWNGGGSQLRFLTLTGNGDYGISLLDMASRTVTPLIDWPGSAQHSSSMSPDGKWMAYASNETGRYEVWIEPFPQHRRALSGHPRRRLASAVATGWTIPLLRSRPSNVPGRREHEGHVVHRRADTAADQRVRPGRVSAAVRPDVRRTPVPHALSDGPVVPADRRRLLAINAMGGETMALDVPPSDVAAKDRA